MSGMSKADLSPVSPRARHARDLFAGLGPTYDRMGAVLSFGQDPRWRRFLVSRIRVPPGNRVLDVTTGTALVAREVAENHAWIRATIVRQRLLREIPV